MQTNRNSTNLEFKYFQVCLRHHLFCRFVLLWGILFKGLNNFDAAEVIKVAFSVEFGETT